MNNSGLVTVLLITLMLIGVGCSDDNNKNPSPTFKLQVNINKGLEGEIARNPNRDSYERGTEVTLTAKPKELFAYWGENQENSNNKTTVIIQEDTSITATFGLSFANENIEKNIRNKINKPEGLILLNDVKNIEKLTIKNTNISSLAGLEYLPNLTSVSFENCTIENFNSLAKKWNSLEKLSLVDTTLNSFAGIGKVENLVNLRIGECSIANWDELETLKKLTHLQISNTVIDNLEFLTSLTKLIEVKLFSNNLNTLAPLNNINTLEEIYTIDNNLSKLDDLSQLNNLTVLYIEQCGLEDITAIKDMPTVEWFTLSNNKISDISPFAELITKDNLKLKWVYLEGNTLNDSANEIISQMESQDIYVNR
jgi:internalin A